jgi:hypothetical protein
MTKPRPWLLQTYHVASVVKTNGDLGWIHNWTWYIHVIVIYSIIYVIYNIFFYNYIHIRIYICIYYMLIQVQDVQVTHQLAFRVSHSTRQSSTCETLFQDSAPFRAQNVLVMFQAWADATNDRWYRMKPLLYIYINIYMYILYYIWWGVWCIIMYNFMVGCILTRG